MAPEDGSPASETNLYPGDRFSPNNLNAGPGNTTPQQTIYTPSNTNFSSMANHGPHSSYSQLGGNGQYTSSSAWLEKQQSSGRKSKILLVSALLGLLALIAVGVGVGVSISNKNRAKSNGNTSNNSNGNGSNPVQQSDPNDPSTFEKDPRLIQSFYGLAYSPNGVIYPQARRCIVRCHNRHSAHVPTYQAHQAVRFRL